MGALSVGEPADILVLDLDALDRDAAPDGRAADANRPDRRVDCDIAAARAFDLAADEQERALDLHRKGAALLRGIIDKFVDDEMAMLAEGQLRAVVERGLEAGPVAGLDAVKEQNIARDGEASGLTGLRR